MTEPASGGQSPITVLLLIGVGRSGSTILDIALGSHPEIEGVGELVNIARLGWINDEYCACGKRVGDCEYWTAVRAALEQSGEPFDPLEYLHLQTRVERARHLVRWLIGPPTEDQSRYLRETAAIYRSIQRVSGRHVIVDSSKNPVRALALLHAPGCDVRILHLVRDPRGVAWSLLKPYRRDEAAGVQRDFASRPAWRTSLLWTLVNLLAEVVARRYPPGRRMVLRYEDLTEDPVRALGDVGRLVGVDVGDLAGRIADGGELPTRHKIAGNRLRMQGSVRLRRDTEWKERLPKHDRVTVRAITGLLMRRYGYRA